MQDTLKKVGFYLQQNPKYNMCFRLKIWQLLIQSIITLISGLLSITTTKDCSSPIHVFLLGLFGIYITGVSLNFFMCFGRSCEAYGAEYCASSFKFCMRGLNAIYLPLYWGFCITEFVWYVLGLYWYHQGGDCSSAFSSGYSASIGFIAFYFILLLLYAIGFLVFMCYIKRTNVPEPKSPEKPPEANLGPRPFTADNTAGNQNPGYYQDPYYSQGPPNDFSQYPDPRFGQGGQYPDPRYGQGGQGYPDPRYDQGGNGYPGYNDPNNFGGHPQNVQGDPRYNTGYMTNQRPDLGPGNFYNTNPLSPPGQYDNQRDYRNYGP